MVGVVAWFVAVVVAVVLVAKMAWVVAVVDHQTGQDLSRRHS